MGGGAHGVSSLFSSVYLTDMAWVVSLESHCYAVISFYNYHCIDYVMLPLYTFTFLDMV